LCALHLENEFVGCKPLHTGSVQLGTAHSGTTDSGTTDS
jgi:hypothetical protein